MGNYCCSEYIEPIEYIPAQHEYLITGIAFPVRMPIESSSQFADALKEFNNTISELSEGELHITKNVSSVGFINYNINTKDGIMPSWN